MKYKEFLKRINEDRTYINDMTVGYNTYHARRFYVTYLECAKHLRAGDKLLSIGAGSAPIEKILSQELGVRVTVIDFPELVDAFAPYYRFLGFDMYRADLTRDSLRFPAQHFDMLLASEIVEHVPKALYDQLHVFTSFMKTTGKIVITTPNLGSFVHILKLLFMKPIMPPAEKVFSNVQFENQDIHRREYLPVELLKEFEKLGYAKVSTRFFFYTYPDRLIKKLLNAAGTIIPRFRPGMMLTAAKI